MPEIADTVHYVTRSGDQPPECRAAIITHAWAGHTEANLRVLDLIKEGDWDVHAAPHAPWAGEDSEHGHWLHRHEHGGAA